MFAPVRVVVVSALAVDGGDSDRPLRRRPDSPPLLWDRRCLPPPRDPHRGRPCRSIRSCPPACLSGRRSSITTRTFSSSSLASASVGDARGLRSRALPAVGEENVRRHERRIGDETGVPLCGAPAITAARLFRANGAPRGRPALSQIDGAEAPPGESGMACVHLGIDHADRHARGTGGELLVPGDELGPVASLVGAASFADRWRARRAPEQRHPRSRCDRAYR